MMHTDIRPWASAILGSLLFFGCGWGETREPLFTAVGQVQNAAGEALPGAVVSDGENSVLGGEDGRFALAVFSPRVSVTKPGMVTVVYRAEEGQPIAARLVAKSGSPRVGLDMRHGGRQLVGLRTEMARQGLVFEEFGGGSLIPLDVLFMVTPGKVEAGEISRILSWIRSGGRLILCGEWGGYPDQDLGTLDALARPAGLGFSRATVKVSPATDDEAAGGDLVAIAGAIAPPSLARLCGAGSVRLYTTTSVTLFEGARSILTTEARAYSVLAKLNSQVVGGVGPYGRGKVFALGDSSLWRDEASASSPLPNWQQGANAALAIALTKW